MNNTDRVLLAVEDIRKTYRARSNGFARRRLTALESVSFEIMKGETVGLIGESGCGKTTLGRIISKTLQPDSGRIFFEGIDITDMNRREFSRYRHKIQMVFQDPGGVLNPSLKISRILEECLIASGVSDKRARAASIENLLPKAGLDETYLDRYPHELSGGQKQRVSVLLALIPAPSLIVADEVVSALDISIRSQVLNLLRSLQTEYGLSFLFITHDLDVAYHMSDRILVMYLGEIVESAAVEDLYRTPMHPYTMMLFASLLTGQSERAALSEHLTAADTRTQSVHVAGCKFFAVCPYAKDICENTKPPVISLDNGHKVFCHRA